MRRFLPGIATMVVSGCFYTPQAWKEETSCEYWTCPQAECCVQFVLDMNDIEECYRVPAPQQDTSDTGIEWVPDITNALLVGCEGAWGSQQCVLEICSPGGEPLGAEVVDTGVEAANTADEALACCDRHIEASDLAWTGSTLDEIDDLVLEINSDCTIDEIQPPSDPRECDWGDNQPIQGSDCDRGEALCAPATADASMRIDPQDSYIEIVSSTETIYSTLDGLAYSATSPKRVMKGLAWGQDFVFADDDFTFNHVILGAEILLSGSGTTYTVPVNQDFELVVNGLREGSEYFIEFAPSTSSGGTWDPANASWTYDYTQTLSSGHTVEVHMEGDLLAVSIP